MAARGRAFLRMLFSSIFVLVFTLASRTEVLTWVGGTDSLWNTASNWSANRVPASSDDVVLDNRAVQQSYKVYLPSGAVAVSIRSLVIIAAEQLSIELVLPSANTVAPAFSTAAYPGIQLGRGALFRNASGASSGSAVSTADSLRLLDGGHFIQQSETAHATLVTRMAIAPAGHEGWMEFDVPGAASYTVSVSNRTYGHLILSARAAGGSKNYLASGSNVVNVKGDFIVGKGVNFNLNSSAAFRVGNAVTVEGNFNLSTGTQSNTFYVGGDLTCIGMLTESGSGAPIVECSGSAMQKLEISGAIQHAVALSINNASGAALLHPLQLASKLILKEGRLFTSGKNLITLSAGAMIVCDTLNTDTYVEGPLQKLGLSGESFFSFPSGKNGIQRWLRLRSPTGDFTVEFFRGDPLLMSPKIDNGIDHLSGVEYWSIMTSSGARAAVELSFDQVSSGGVTSLEELRVALLRDGKWNDGGNTSITGTAGSSGSVTSTFQSDFSTPFAYFTLASAKAGMNPLPLNEVSFHLKPESNGVLLSASVNSSQNMVRLGIQAASDAKNFKLLKGKVVHDTDREIQFLDDCQPGKLMFYRAVATDAEGRFYYSKTIPFQPASSRSGMLQVYPVPAVHSANINIYAASYGRAQVRIIGSEGHCYFFKDMQLNPGANNFSFYCTSWPAGAYQVQVIQADGTRSAKRILVLP